jgi:hypothetical protein
LPLPRVFVEAFWSPALDSRWKSAGKSNRHIYSVNYRVPRGEDLSLSGGASMSVYVFFKLSITLFCSRGLALIRRGRPSRVALTRAAMRLAD